MRFTLLLTALLIMGLSQVLAQPVLNQNDIGFHIGDTQQIDSIDFVDMSSMVGANMTWDLQYLVPYGTLINSEIVEPSTLSTGDSFPTSTVARTMFVLDFFIDQFFNFESSAQQLLGTTLSFGSNEYISIHTDPEIAFPSPMTYGDSGTDTYTYDLFGTPGETNNSGLIEWDVPGYGTLLVNGQTYTDVLMYRYIRRDTTFATFSGITFESYLLTESYFFMKAGYHYPIVIFTESNTIDEFSPPETTYEASVLLSQTTDLEDLSDMLADLKIYPNPAIERTINLQLKMGKAGELSVALYAIDGRMIDLVLDQVYYGNDAQQLELELPKDLESGIYSLLISSERRSMQKSLVVH